MTFGDPELDARLSASPERLMAEQQAEVLLARQREETSARMEDVARSSTLMREETRRRDTTYERDMRAVDELEQQQLEVIRSHTAGLTSSRAIAMESAKAQVAADARLVEARAVTTAGRQSGRGSPLPPLSGGDERRSGGPAVSSEAWTLLREQLDHQRLRSDRLQNELEDRDRLILEHKLADAERERREIALRVRMVEAMAALRERERLMQEEQADANLRAIEMRVASGRRDASIPRHPLYESQLLID